MTALGWLWTRGRGCIEYSCTKRKVHVLFDELIYYIDLIPSNIIGVIMDKLSCITQLWVKI